MNIKYVKMQLKPVKYLYSISNTCVLQLPFHVPDHIIETNKRPIRVLSLFDGISTGLVALKSLGLTVQHQSMQYKNFHLYIFVIQIGTYVASEIHDDSIKLVKQHHAEVFQIGDITKVSNEKLRSLGPFDLLMGGSPCNDLSGANPNRKGLYGSLKYINLTHLICDQKLLQMLQVLVNCFLSFIEF